MSQARRALIVVDVQNDYDGGELPIEYPNVKNSLNNIGRVMDAASAISIPVIVIHNILNSSAPFMACAVQRWRFSSGCKSHPARSLRPEAIVAVMEVTR